MRRSKKILAGLCALCAAMTLALPAQALEYTFEEMEGAPYGKSTSVEVVQTPDGGAQKNEDISKNAALIPPGFGSASSNALGTGDYLTPNLAPNALPGTGMLIAGGLETVLPPAPDSVPADLSAGITYAPGVSTVTVTTPEPTNNGHTEVTEDLYFGNGSLGTLEIPAIDLKVGIYEGTDSAALKKGAGHFEDSSIWDGNVGLASHNRGSSDYFGQIHTLELGDRMTLTTRLGVRTYEVTSVSKVSETDRSALAAAGGNMLTLYTCVRDERDYRWCVQGCEIV